MSKARDIASRSGLIQVVPTSVTVGSGNGSVSANGTITFTGVSSLGVNGCFSNDYKNYRMVFEAFTGNAASAGVFIQMRTGLTTSNASYYYGSTYSLFASPTAVAGSNGANTVSAPTVYVSSGLDSSASMDIINPFASSKWTTMQGSGTNFDAVVGFAMQHRVSASYDGFTLNPSTGTYSGTIRVYGYNNG